MGALQVPGFHIHANQAVHHEAVGAAGLDRVAVQQSTVAVLRGPDAGLERERQHEVVLRLRAGAPPPHVLVQRDGVRVAPRVDEAPQHDPVGVRVRVGGPVEHHPRGGEVAQRGVAAEQLGARAEAAEEQALGVGEEARVEGAQGAEGAA